MGWACSTYGRDEKWIQSLGQDLEQNRPFGRPRHKQEYNIKVDLKRNWVGGG
jgi:hypothetical protein